MAARWAQSLVAAKVDSMAGGSVASTVADWAARWVVTKVACSAASMAVSTAAATAAETAAATAAPSAVDSDDYLAVNSVDGSAERRAASLVVYSAGRWAADWAETKVAM